MRSVDPQDDLLQHFNTGFFLRLNDPDTAEFLSRSIGEREIIKRMEGRQLSPKDIGDRTTGWPSMSWCRTASGSWCGWG